MPLSNATIDYSLSDLAGANFDARRTRVWATTNIPGGTIVDSLGNEIHLGITKGTVNSDGTGSISVITPGTGSNPASWQTTIHVDYPNGRARAIRDFGPFTITASADLADLVAEQEVSPEYAGTLIASLDAYADSAAASSSSAAASASSAATSAALANSIVITDLGTSDGQVGTLLGSPTSLTSTAVAAKIASQVGLERNAAANGTANDSAAIQSLLASTTVGKVSLRSVTPDGAGTPYYVLRDTVDIGRSHSLSADGYRSRIVVPTDGGDYTSGIIFRLNTNAAGDWVTSNPGFPASKLESLHVQALAAAAAGHSIIVAELGGSQTIEDFYVSGVDQLVRQVNQYSDLVKVSRGQAWKKRDTTKYLIELGYTGDGVVIDQVGMSHDPTDTDRPKLVFLRYKNGASLTNLVNGDIYVQDSRAVNISGLHHESGFVTIDNSSAEVHNALLYMRGAAAGSMAGTPLVIASSTVGATSARSQDVNLHDIGFAYTTGLLGGYPTTGTANFQITGASGAVNRARVTVRNLYRWINSASSFVDSIHTGVTCGDATFDAYSHLASRQSSYEMGSWLISGDLPALESSLGLDSAAADSFRAWSDTTGTYYYKVVNYHDTKRSIGRLGSSEQSVALTNGGNGAALVISATSRVPSMLRVYRGTAAGSYNRYVDIPFMSGGRLHDAGSDIAGFPWVARTAGAVDTVNANLDAGFRLGTGEATATSDAYGKAIVHARSLSTAPTVGSWRRGDVVYGPPTTGSAGLLIGWTRLTDCTTASPAHVMGTDWAPLYASTRGLTRGTGSPNSAVIGDPGDLFLRSDGVAGVNMLYTKQTGAGTNTGWDVTNPFAPTVRTTVQLAAATDAINTAGKTVGKAVFNSTTNKPVWATGSTATATWVDATGTVAHTPA